MTVVRLPDGRQLHTWEGGSPSGRPVVFVHGCPDCRLAAVTGSGAALAAGVRLISFSRPGYGLSDPCDSTHLTVADDIVALADASGIDRFQLIGMSVGGPYALACAARHPDRVSSVTLIAASIPNARPALAMSTVDEGIDLFRPDFEQYVARMDPTDLDDTALAFRARQALDPCDAPLLPTDLLAATMRESLARPDGYLRDAALTFTSWPFSVSDVGCPVHLFYGAHDTNAPPSNGGWYAENLPTSRLTVLETTHLATLILNWPQILSLH